MTLAAVARFRSRDSRSRLKRPLEDIFRAAVDDVILQELPHQTRKRTLTRLSDDG